MKKTSLIILLSVIGSVMLMTTSCEPDSTGGFMGGTDGKVSFVVGHEAQSNTRSSVIPESKPCLPSQTTAMSSQETIDVPSFRLTCSESSLDEECPLTSGSGMDVTRGTPVYTENLQSFSANTYAQISGSSGSYSSVWQGMEDAVFERTTNGQSTVWSHSYTNNESWPDGNGNLVFFFRYPINKTLSGVSYSRASGKNVITLTDYETPGAGAGISNAAQLQDDLVFGTITVNEGNKSTNNRVLFYHPFAGVKFKLGDLPDNVRVTAITLQNVLGKGSCVLTPYYGNETVYQKNNSNSDVRDQTKSASCASWTGLTNRTSFRQSFTVSDIDPNINSSLFPVGFVSETVNGRTPNADQLNDASLSKTFILIPQTFDATNSLTMVFDIMNGDVAQQRSITLNNVNWQAGKLYTYTITIDDRIDVAVDDELNGNVKSNVIMTNTGNVSEYLRAAIEANWYDATGQIVAFWNSADGTFSNLASSTYWITGADGFYYFKQPVAAGQSIPAAQALFTSYTAPASPPVAGAHLEMNIIVQAVAADKSIVEAAWGTTVANALP